VDCTNLGPTRISEPVAALATKRRRISGPRYLESIPALFFGGLGGCEILASTAHEKIDGDGGRTGGSNDPSMI
jgi:hypothetical protein